MIRRRGFGDGRGCFCEYFFLFLVYWLSALPVWFIPKTSRIVVLIERF